MKMTIDEMKLAVCEKLPGLFYINPDGKTVWLKSNTVLNYRDEAEWKINWPAIGLQVCHEAEKLLTEAQTVKYYSILCEMLGDGKPLPQWTKIHATYEQRLEALCRVWWSERFNS